jgi:hypothetical protein
LTLPVTPDLMSWRRMQVGIRDTTTACSTSLLQNQRCSRTREMEWSLPSIR